MKKIHLGIMGAGFISQVAHLPAFSKVENCKIVSIADPRGDMGRKVAEKYEIPEVYISYEEMLEKSSIDAVLVSLARPCVGPAVRRCLERKIPVLSEKPMAGTFQDAKKLVEYSKKNKTQYYIGFMKRCDAGVLAFKQELQKWVLEEEFGSIRHIICVDFCGEYGVKIPQHIPRGEKPSLRYPEWRQAPEEITPDLISDYKYSINVAIHDLNLLRYLFPNNLQPRSFRVNRGFSQTILLDSQNSCITLEVGKAAIGQWDQAIFVYFDKGRLSLRLHSPLSRRPAIVEEVAYGKKMTESPLLYSTEWAFERQAELFIGGLLGGETLSSTAQDSLKDIEILDKLWKMM